jgi:hypothetical protein
VQLCMRVVVVVGTGGLTGAHTFHQRPAPVDPCVRTRSQTHQMDSVPNLLLSSPPDFKAVAQLGRLHLAFDASSAPRTVSTPLLALASPPRTDTFALVDAFMQAAWECDEGEAALRQDLLLVEQTLSGKRVPADTLLAWLALKTHLDARDDVKSLMEGYMSVLSSEKKRGGLLDVVLWQAKYARLVGLYVRCLVSMGQLEAAKSAVEPHRVDGALLTEAARRSIEAELQRAERPLAAPASSAAAAAASSAAAPPAAASSSPTTASTQSITPADLLRQQMKEQEAMMMKTAAASAAAAVLVLVAWSERRRIAASFAGATGNIATLLFGNGP